MQWSKVTQCQDEAMCWNRMRLSNKAGDGGDVEVVTAAAATRTLPREIPRRHHHPPAMSSCQSQYHAQTRATLNAQMIQTNGKLS